MTTYNDSLTPNDHRFHDEARNVLRRRPFAAAAATLIFLATLAAAQLGTAAPAGAWAFSSNVTLNGTANCISPTEQVTKVELWAKRMDTGAETYVRASLDNGRYARKYAARLTVPGAGLSVWARVTCKVSGAYWTGGPRKLEVKRPKTGTTQTRMLCPDSVQVCR